MKLDYFWKLLLLILTTSFIIVKKVKGYLKLALAMLYHRQKRAKLFKSLIIDEEEIVSRIHKLPKHPTEVIICLGGGQKATNTVHQKINQIINWTQTLQISKHKLYTVKSFESQMLEKTTQCQSFKSFYQEFICAINKQNYARSPSTCPLILVFNSIPYMGGLPFSDIKGGQIMFCGELDTFSMIDYEECFKRFAGIEQRLGK